MAAQDRGGGRCVLGVLCHREPCLVPVLLGAQPDPTRWIIIIVAANACLALALGPVHPEHVSYTALTHKAP